MTLRDQDIEDLWSGDTLILRCAVKDADGEPVNQEGGTAVYEISKKAGTTALVTKSSADDEIELISIDGTNDGWEWTLEPEDTEPLKGLGTGRGYYHELEVTDADGNVSTVFVGTIYLETDQVQ
jgi:hypothetical protein